MTNIYAGMTKGKEQVMSEEKYTITIPAELYKKIEGQLKESGISSVNEFILKKMEGILGEKKESFSDDDEEKVKERLKALGYMD